MSKKVIIGFVVGLTLIFTLLGGAVVSGAQTAPGLTETYTWQPYGLSVSYPTDWTVAQKAKAISVHPSGQDVTDGLGPELILFLVADPNPGGMANSLDAALPLIINQFAQSSNGTLGAVAPGMLDRYLIRTADVIWAGQDAVGAVTVIGIDRSTVLGMAYIVRRSEAATSLPTLRAIFNSATFGTSQPRTTSNGSSESVASIQLPQRHDWADTGLVLYFPAGWDIQSKSSTSQQDTVVATPPTAAPRAQQSYVIEATGVPGMTQVNLRHMAQALATSYGGATSDITDITVAGYPGVIYDILDSQQNPPYHVRTVLVDIADRNMVVPIVMGADEPVWDSFHLLASAFITNIERPNQPLTLAPATTLHSLSSTPLSAPSGAFLQAAGTTQQFVWEEYGVTFTIPSNWQTSQGGQNYDLALVSPEAASSGSGTYLLFSTVPSLGQGATMESSLQPLVDQVKGELKPFTAAGLAGMTVDFTDDKTKTLHHLILVPYGSSGEYLYVQTSALSADDDKVVLDVLNSMVINPPDADHAKVDTAWQASLAADGKLLYGDPKAPIQMIEYLDFSCSHCVNYSYALEHLIPLEADAGHVQIEFVPLDIVGGDLSNAAAQATFCATEQGKGYTTYKALIAGYVNEGRDAAYTRDGIDKLLGAPEVGVDVTALNACMDAGKYKDVITKADTRAQDAGVTGTPSILLAKGSDTPAFLTLPNGQQWSGEVPIHALRIIFKAVIGTDTSLQDAANAYFKG